MAELFTVINTFTLKDPAQAGEFEARFLTHVAWMRVQDGFDSHQAVRLTERPGVYVNIGRWRSPQDFKQVLGSEVFQEHAKEFHRLVDVVAAPSLNVLRAGDKGAYAPVVVVESIETSDEPETFEKAWSGYVDELAAREGFRHAELSRSLVKPGAYTFAGWWTTAEAYSAARAAVQAPAEGAADLAAHVTAHPTDAAAA
ncbi:antibiotic biosynthesis monooxygenase family protein [Streptomyces sp. NPDC050421]|uniref:antibiotic biosynthesis monooxygenase family protein n=1 Tax=unclassified Streptomyces TaxID=2593676 RepID=UPI0037B58314